MEEDGWWYREEQMAQKISTEIGVIMKKDLEALQVNCGMGYVHSIANYLLFIVMVLITPKMVAPWFNLAFT